MGKVYSKALRELDAELERFGIASAETRTKANSYRPPDLSSYDLCPEFLCLEGITLGDVRRWHREWNKLTPELTIRRRLFEEITKESMLGITVVDKVKKKKWAKPSAHEGDTMYRQFQTLAVNGKVSVLDYVCGLAMISTAKIDEKALFIFSCYDFERIRSLSKDELLLLVSSTMRGLCKLKHMPMPDMEGLEWMINQALKEAETANKLTEDGRLNVAGFIQWCKLDPSPYAVFSNSTAAEDNNTHASEKKLAQQKQLLEKLARVESALEVFGMPKFALSPLIEILPGQENDKCLSNKYENLTLVDKNISNQNKNDLDIFPLILSSDIPNDMLQEKDLKGLSMQIYMQMTDVEKDHWRNSSKKIQHMAEYIATLNKLEQNPKGSLMSTTIDIDEKWIKFLGDLCAIRFVNDEEESVPEHKNTTQQSESVTGSEKQREELHETAADILETDDGTQAVIDNSLQSRESETSHSIELGKLIDWIVNWPLPQHILAKKDSRHYWAWARVITTGSILTSLMLLRICKSFFYWVLNEYILKFFRDREPAKDFYGKEIKVPKNNNKALSYSFELLVADEENDKPDVSLSISYLNTGKPIKAGLISKDAESNDDNEDDNDDDEPDDYEEFRKYRRTKLLRYGKICYDYIILKYGGGMKQAYKKLSSNESKIRDCKGFLLVELNTSMEASKKDRKDCVDKLKAMFCHPFWQMLPWLYGIHVVEFSEFEGSASLIRIAFFLSKECSSNQQCIKYILRNFSQLEEVAVKLDSEDSLWEVLSGLKWNGDTCSLWKKRVDQNTTFENNDNIENSEEKYVQDGEKTILKDTVDSSKEMETDVFELTDLGLNCVEDIFQTFDIDESGGFSLEEMNNFQKVMGHQQFGSEDEYRSLMAEERYQCNEKGELTLKGLTTVYEKAPPTELVHDAGRCGALFSSLARCEARVSLTINKSRISTVCSQWDECKHKFFPVDWYTFFLNHVECSKNHFKYNHWAEIGGLDCLKVLENLLFHPGYASEMNYRGVIRESLEQGSECQDSSSNLYKKAKELYQRKITISQQNEDENSVDDEDKEEIEITDEDEEDEDEDFYDSEGDEPLPLHQKLRGFMLKCIEFFKSNDDVITSLSSAQIRLENDSCFHVLCEGF